MSFIEELAAQIWEEPGFKADYLHLETVNVLAELSSPTESGATGGSW